MSGEFGSCESGYFHTQIETAAADCLHSANAEITQKWGKVLEAMYPIAHAISWYEARDSGIEAPIMATLEQLPDVQRAIDDVQRYVRPFKDIADAAVRYAIRTEGKKTATAPGSRE